MHQAAAGVHFELAVWLFMLASTISPCHFSLQQFLAFGKTIFWIEYLDELTSLIP